MATDDVRLMAHLLRRAGFGATRRELERYESQGYEAAVDELLAPAEPGRLGDDLVRRYHHEYSGLMGQTGPGATWLYRMISTDNPLQEKMALFWHGLFATGYPKITNGKVMLDQLRMFRRYGLGSFKTLLVELSKDPAMIIWLDNQDNHTGTINENYGRELLELFSLGVGNYTEDDVKECARAFTGWTIGNMEYMKLRAIRDSIWPYGRISWHFRYREEDHDDGEKTFLGETGRFNGEDIIEIICRQEATAKFLARHMYHYFVADEPPVPQWPYTPSQRPRRRGCLGPSVLRQRLRHQGDAAGALHLGLLPVPGHLVREGQEPRRPDGRGAPPHGGVPDARAGVRGRVPEDDLHGPAAHQPALGGGLAPGHRVGRHGDAGGAHQLRYRAPGQDLTRRASSP